MNSSENGGIEKRLAELQLVPVVALPSVEAGLRLAEILVKCELPVAEVTFRTPFAAEAIAAMKKAFPELLLLAGTVLTREHADISRDAGAECIVIPGFLAQLVEHCLSRDIMVCPGTATPTEVLQCLSMGIRAVKFFPAEIAGGIPMLKAMSAVYSDMRFMPTGGIGTSNLLNYLALEQVFCCGGSWLAPEAMLKEGRWKEIEENISSAIKLLS